MVVLAELEGAVVAVVDARELEEKQTHLIPVQVVVAGLDQLPVMAVLPEFILGTLP